MYYAEETLYVIPERVTFVEDICKREDSLTF